MATGTDGLESSPDRPRAETDSRPSNLVLLALGGLVVAAGGLLLVWGSKLTFLLDDWEFLIYRREFNADAILEPHGEHIVVIPMLLYKALLGLFGMDSAFPFRVVSVTLFLLSAVLLFVFLRRRVGDWAALAGTAVVLFLGAASEDLLWSFQMGYFGCMSAGLGALLAMERDDRRGEVIAALLLALAVLFSSLGIPFVIGIAVLILLREDRWRRIWIVAVPIVVFAIWWLGWGHEAESAIGIGTLAQTPAFVFNGFAAALSSLTGLALPSASNSPGGLEWGRLLLVVAVIAGGWWMQRQGKLSRWFWPVLALGLSFWFLAGLNQEPGRAPESSRYQYVGVVFVLLLAAEMLRGRRVAGKGLWALAAITAIAVLPNLHMLHASYDNYHRVSKLEKADLAALDIARDTVEPYFTLTKDRAGTAFVHVEAGPYLAAADEFGTPAYSVAELEEAAQPARYAADRVLAGALEVGFVELGADDFPDATPKEGAAEAGVVEEVPVDGCLTVHEIPASPQLSLPPGGVIIRAGDSPVESVKLARFSQGAFPIKSEDPIGSGEVAELEIPADRAENRWQMRLESQSQAVVCGVEAGRG